MRARTLQSADRAQKHYQAARDARDEAILRALADGWSQRRIADATGLSAGRIGQIATSKRREA